jgi:hypothetical protein
MKTDRNMSCCGQDWIKDYHLVGGLGCEEWKKRRKRRMKKRRMKKGKREKRKEPLNTILVANAIYQKNKI